MNFGNTLTGLLALMDPWVIPIAAVAMFICGGTYALAFGDMRAKANAKGGAQGVLVGAFVMKGATVIATTLAGLPH